MKYSRVRILVANDIDMAGVKNLSSKEFSVKYLPGISNEEIIKKYGSYDVLIIRSVRKIDEDFLKSTSFRVIATGSKGTDHIDTAFAGLRGIKILNADDSNNISAAEHALGLLLAIEKNIVLSDSLVRNGDFGFYDYERRELYKKDIGIIGFGKVGSYLGKLCKALGMNVFANDIDPNVKLRNKNFLFKSLDHILKNCEIISIHIPLNKKNFNFFSEDKLKMLSQETILINTSRGDVIDENFLIQMLKKKKIKYAGLDVFRHEPLIDKGFAGLENVLLTNHIAGKTKESRDRVSENIFSQVAKIFKK